MGKMTPAFTDPRQTPYGFAKLVLGVDMYDGMYGQPDWQARVYTWFENPLEIVRGAVVAPNGSGRTSKIIAPLALSLAALSRKATIVIMLPDGTQLDEQTWNNIEAYQEKLPSWTWNYRRIESPSGSRIIGRAVDEAKRAEGFHPGEPIEGPLYIFFDEAKSGLPEVFKGIDKCQYTGLLLVSSPGEELGEFYNAFNDNAHLYRRIMVGLADCPHITAERIAYLKDKYKHDPEYLAATLYGRFMKQEGAERYVLSVNDRDLCLNPPPVFNPLGGTVAFCDFAGGGDENVLAIRRGNRIVIPAAWRDKNEMSACSRFVVEFRAAGLRQEQIWGDADGAGKPMISRLEELGWTINRFHNGAAALAKEDYVNRSAEVWLTGARQIADRQVILPAHDALLHKQLTQRRKVYKDGRIGVESKEDLKKRGVDSPDRADAALACIAIEAPDSYIEDRLEDRWSVNRDGGRRQQGERFESLAW